MILLHHVCCSPPRQTPPCECDPVRSPPSISFAPETPLDLLQPHLAAYLGSPHIFRGGLGAVQRLHWVVGRVTQWPSYATEGQRNSWWSLSARENSLQQLVGAKCHFSHGLRTHVHTQKNRRRNPSSSMLIWDTAWPTYRKSPLFSWVSFT